MNLLVYSIAAGLFTWSVAGGLSSSTAQSRLQQAKQLENQGQFAEAVSILEPMVEPKTATVNDGERGVAFNLLGPAYEGLGKYPNAIHCYESAIQLLRHLPSERAVYASALTNLGSLQIYTGQFQTAKDLLLKAQQLYAISDDHVGLTEVGIDFATLALGKGDVRAAKRYVADTTEEAEQAKDLSDNDQAAVYNVQGSLAMKLKDFAAAVRDYQRSIDAWVRFSGPKYYYVALEYSLQADAYRELHEYAKASSDISSAFRLEEQTVGRNSRLYYATELASARLLKTTGKKAEAKRLKTDALAGLATLGQQQCDGCSLTATAFR
jgi:tetratricopeptide (TPR) repeat protein